MMVPESTIPEKIKAFFESAWDKVSPPPAPAYESTFRLSKEEYALFNLIADLRMPVALEVQLALEWSEAIAQGSEYPFRLPDETLVTSICISPMFKSVRDWGLQR